MANTKAPLEEIQLCTLYAIVDENNIVSSKSNRSILEKFKNLRPYSAVYLSV